MQPNGLRHLLIYGVSLQQFVELCLEVALCNGTYMLAYEFAALKEEQCRDIAYTILCSYIVVLLNVALTYNYLCLLYTSPSPRD